MSADAIHEAASACPGHTLAGQNSPKDLTPIFFSLHPDRHVLNVAIPKVAYSIVSVLFSSTKDGADAHTGLLKGKDRQFRGVQLISKKEVPRLVLMGDLIYLDIFSAAHQEQIN